MNELYAQFNNVVTAKCNMSCIQIKITDYRRLSIL